MIVCGLSASPHDSHAIDATRCPLRVPRCSCSSVRCCLQSYVHCLRVCPNKFSFYASDFQFSTTVEENRHPCELQCRYLQRLETSSSQASWIYMRGGTPVRNCSGMRVLGFYLALDATWLHFPCCTLQKENMLYSF